MFVRFRKSGSGGFQPEGVPAVIACQGNRLGRACKGPCRRKPRCRWVVKSPDKECRPLQPHRIHVSLVANTRKDGKVRQEHIAQLGSIDGYMLASFFDKASSTLAGTVKDDDWRRRSIRARQDFWSITGPRLKRLENRLGPDAKRIRMAIHKRIPFPKEPERALLELLDAKASYESNRGMLRSTERKIRDLEALIVKDKEFASTLRAMAMHDAQILDKAQKKLNRLRAQP